MLHLGLGLRVAMVTTGRAGIASGDHEVFSGDRFLYFYMAIYMNTILKIKRIRYRLILAQLGPRTSTVLNPFYCELVIKWQIE